MTFLSPRWLWLLAAVPLLAFLAMRAARHVQRTLRMLVGTREDTVLLEQQRPGQRRLGMVLRLGAFALLAIGAAGPEWGHELVRRASTGSDVIFLIDVSASMDARDVAPSRLEEARREALALLERLGGSKVGVVAFAGDAVRLCPLTLDRSAARLVVESLTSGSVSQPGSDLGRGLRMAARALPGGRRSEQVIVLWTDGEDLESQADAAREELTRAGLRVFVVGVGTPAGDVVPVLDDAGRAVDVKRDESGGAVRSRLDERLLRSLARSTRGGYFSASRPGGELPRLLAALGSVSRGARGERLVERAVPRFPWCAGAAALLLGFELARSRRRRGGGEKAQEARAKRPKRAVKKAAAAAAILLLACLAPTPARAQSDWAKADAAFRKGRFAEAESLYQKRARRRAPPAVRVNQATARARAGRPIEAEPMLAAAKAAPGRAGQVAAYNLGTLLATRGEYRDGIRELREALERNPNDDDARYNLEVAMRRMNQPEQPNPQNPKPRPQTGGQPQPSGGQGAPQPPPQPQPSQNQQRPTANTPQEGMTRERAEQLLGSLEELERLEHQRMNKVRVMRERRGRDW
jgi:Ca-activated chloride channel family protein